jgi:hypothetical protein
MIPEILFFVFFFFIVGVTFILVVYIEKKYDRESLSFYEKNYYL